MNSDKEISNQVKTLYDKIESIKKSINFSNGDKPELWIQRQNLQDLYQQIILKDIDFTIDKKLEQDLWNLVFKSQINYFQSQIKESSSNGSSGVSSGGSASSKAKSSTVSSSMPSQKRIEAQASLFFFLEAARGFYIKLLQDIALTYESYLDENTLAITYSNGFYSFPFSQRFTSLFGKIDSNKNRLKKKLLDTNDLTDKSLQNNAKEKQILYMCQHILTHLGDIARYANLFQQAQVYYMHAIKLVPFLGQPYNQLGILYETGRTNQLSTTFFYIRSISVKFPFPLATANLENYFRKLAEIPLNRYHPSLSNDYNSNANQQFLIKLSHKDLITLYLQINAIIYSMASSLNPNMQKINSYLDLFKQSFNSFVETPVQRNRLDSYQLIQMISILFFIINHSMSKVESNKSNHMLTTATNFLFYFIEKLTELIDSISMDSSNKSKESLETNSLTALPTLYLIINFVTINQDSAFLFLSSKQNNFKSRQKQIDFYKSFVKLLNQLNDLIITKSSNLIILDKCSDYPLNEDRILESFLPLKDVHKDFDFKRYLITNQYLDESDEDALRAKRIVNCMIKLIKRSESDCAIQIEETPTKKKLFSMNEKLFPEIVSPKVKVNREMTPPNNNTLTVSPQQQQPNTQRKRRQNVAISSIQNNMLALNDNFAPIRNQSTVQTNSIENNTNILDNLAQLSNLSKSLQPENDASNNLNSILNQYQANQANQFQNFYASSNINQNNYNMFNLQNNIPVNDMMFNFKENKTKQDNSLLNELLMKQRIEQSSSSNNPLETILKNFQHMSNNPDVNKISISNEEALFKSMSNQNQMNPPPGFGFNASKEWSSSSDSSYSRQQQQQNDSNNFLINQLSELMVNRNEANANLQYQINNNATENFMKLMNLNRSPNNSS